MPAPATADDLLDRVRRSGVVPPDDLDAFVATLDRSALSPQALLNRLLAARLLTPFQADRLGAGKYKGFVLGSYVILDKLGGGGMGQVYLAEHTSMKRLVAVKVLPNPIAENPVARERFLREARSAAALDHPNIIRVHDLNREGKLLYLVMEYVEGLSLHELVAKAGKRPVAAAADYARQVAVGLQKAHDLGMVHRDVKPGNLLVDRAGVVKLLDLGLVRTEADAPAQLTVKLGSGSILGTADYLAPEQAIDSSAVDHRADIYGLGATLYFLLAGHPMFPEGKAAQKLIWQQWREPTPIREVRADVPAGLARVLEVALAKRREHRFQSAAELAEALAPFAFRSPPDAAVVPLPPPRRGVRPAGGSAPDLPVFDPTTPSPPAPDSTVGAFGSSHVVQVPEQVWERAAETAAARSELTPLVVAEPPPRVPADDLHGLDDPTPVPPRRWKRVARRLLVVLLAVVVAVAAFTLAILLTGGFGGE